MVFNFEKEKGKLITNGFKMNRKRGKNFEDFIFRKKKMMGLSEEVNFFRVMDTGPGLNDMIKFVDDAKKFEGKERLDADGDNIFFIAPNIDRRAITKLIESRGGIMKRGKLKKLIRPISCSVENKNNRTEAKKEIIFKKPTKTEEKNVDAHKLYKKIIKFSRDFTPGKVGYKDESVLEDNFWNYMLHPLKSEKEKPKRQYRIGSSQLDIYFPNKRIGIELKRIVVAGDLRKLVGQIDDYSKICDMIIVVALNVGNIPKDKIDDRIETIENRIKSLGKEFKFILR